jgi:hypothetical protein
VHARACAAVKNSTDKNINGDVCVCFFLFLISLVSCEAAVLYMYILLLLLLREVRVYETDGAVKVGLISKTAYYYVIHFSVIANNKTKCSPLGESRKFMYELKCVIQ